MTTPSHQTPLDLAAFQNPAAKTRIAPFWFWNGAMSKELVEKQVEQMARAGVGGFFIHPRQGLTLPYLSKAWFERVKTAVEAAQKWGMEAWLYDEYPYPSGIAGGLLTANHPEFRARLLENLNVDVSGENPVRHEFPLGRLVSALACPLENGEVNWDAAVDIRAEFGVVLTRELFWRWPMAHIPYNEKRFMADEGRLVLEWTPPQNAQDWRVFVAIETEQRGFKYFDCFVDPLCMGAAEEFIRLTHEKYAQSVGEHFGATIPGIFTDEIEPPLWSPKIERELASAGLDMAELAPALHHSDHPRASEVRFAWRECGLRLFYERWEAPIAAWCAAHGLIWTVEKPTARPSQFATFSQPATDAGHRRIDLPPETLGGGDLRANHRAAIAAAEHQDRAEVRCECFHSLGWGATLQDQKWAIDWLCVQGVNRFTPHAFYATSSGLAKHDAAPSFFAENPYWPHFRALADYAGRLGAAMSTGRERARIALLHPTESQWVGSAQSPAARREYEHLMNALLANHHSFHPVDARALLAATPQNGALELGRAHYETLLIPPLCAVTDETLAAVRAALQAGMRVLMAAPLEEDAAFAGAAEMLNWDGIEAIATREDWAQILESERVLSIREVNETCDENPAECEEIWALWREAGDQQLLFVCNTGPRALWAQIEIKTSVENWQNWSLETGSATSVESQIEAGNSRFTLDLAPFDSALLVGTAAKVAPLSAKAAFLSPILSSISPISASLSSISTPISPISAPISSISGSLSSTSDLISATTQPLLTTSTQLLDTSGEWEFRPESVNALRLNRWEIALDEGGIWRETEALPLRFLDQVARQWIEAAPTRGENPVWYRRRVEADFVPDNLQILVENGAILGDWTLLVNGEEVPKSEFSPTSYHGDDKISAPLKEFFRAGENLLALRVENAPEMGGLRTPLHLTGSFALGGEENRTLVELPARAKFGDLVAAGLPHFSGAATYARSFESAALGEIVALAPGFEEIAELKIDGESLGARPWSPYQWALPADLPARVRVEITVTNTLLPFIEGQFWDAPTHLARRV